MPQIDLGKIRPTLDGEYDAAKVDGYDILCIVKHAGVTWISKTAVPEGEAPSDTSAYWVRFVDEALTQDEANALYLGVLATAANSAKLEDMTFAEVLTAIVDAITNGAGAAYDTLLELQQEIEANDGDISTILTTFAKKIGDNSQKFKVAPAIEDDEATNKSQVETLIATNMKELTHDMSSDADYTLSVSENLFERIKITDSTTVLTVARNIIVDIKQRTFALENTSLQPLTVKTADGAGITVDAGSTVVLRGDGVDVVMSDHSSGLTIVDEVVGRNGYRVYSDGHIEQWGAYHSGAAYLTAAGTFNITFPISFPNECESVLITPIITGAQHVTAALSVVCDATDGLNDLRATDVDIRLNNTLYVHGYTWKALGR